MYSLEELKFDIRKCKARKVHVVIDQSYAGEIAQAFKNSDDHKNVIVFASGKDHEYSYNDDYTLHWVQANHKQDCTRQVHEVSGKFSRSLHFMQPLGFFAPIGMLVEY